MVAQHAQQCHIDAFLRGQLGFVNHRWLNENAACTQHRLVHRDLIGCDHHKKIRLALWHHGTVNALAKPHVAGNGATALAHPVQLAFLHVHSGTEGNVGQNVRGLDNALPAQSRDHHVRRFTAHGTSHTRGSIQLPAGSYGGQSPRKAAAIPGRFQSAS